MVNQQRDEFDRKRFDKFHSVATGIEKLRVSEFAIGLPNFVTKCSFVMILLPFMPT